MFGEDAKLPAGGIRDVFVHAEYDATSGGGRLQLAVDADAPAHVSIPQLGIAAASTDEEFAFETVRPWSAEDPFRYDAEVFTGTERVALRIGFRTVTITDEGVLTVNGRRIVLRGVNRHEFDADRGRSVTRESMRHDVEMMKQHNINAVRTSHYPPHPGFLDLCDELGIMVWEEIPWCRSGIGNDAWQQQAHRMVRNMIDQHYNHPAVILWGLGNEDD